jgi:hypothetical protein
VAVRVVAEFAVEVGCRDYCVADPATDYDAHYNSPIPSRNSLPI